MVSHVYMSMLQDWSGQNVSSIASELCGFITVLSGTIILHATREQETASTQGNKGLLFSLPVPSAIIISGFSLTGIG